MVRFVTTSHLTGDAARIRMEVFVQEQGFSQEFDGQDDVSYHIVAYEGDTAVAVCRFVPGEDGICTVGRVAVDKDHRGRSLGAEILAEVERQAEAMGQKAVVLGAQVRAKGFYERQGYSAFGDEYMDEWCPHIMMRKVLRG